MLVIRLQRTGRKNSPAYRMVVAEHSAPVKGKYQEILGHYLPSRDPVELTYDEARVSHWISKGATPSNTVARLLSKHGVKGLETYVARYTKKRSKNEPEPAPEQPAAQAPAAEQAPVEAEKPKEAGDTEKKE